MKRSPRTVIAFWVVFAFDLAAAVVAHRAVGDGPQAWGWPAATMVLWGLSYCFWRRLPAAPATASTDRAGGPSRQPAW